MESETKYKPSKTLIMDQRKKTKFNYYNMEIQTSI